MNSIERANVADLYALVPKTYDANLQWRDDIIRRCAASEKFKAGIVAACRMSILFWINAFGWLFEPRKKAVLPFITWPYQDKFIVWLQAAIGVHDAAIPKSRDMGVTWMVLYVFDHYFLFDSNVSFMLVSRNEDLVINHENTDSLYWKVNFIHEKQPRFLRPRMPDSRRLFKNLDANNTIDGEATTGDVGRGGRRLAELLDEFPAVPMHQQQKALDSTQANTNSRIIVGTPSGVPDRFAEMVLEGDQKYVYRMHWTEHPEKNVGLYYVNGEPRSPWFDAECKRPGATPKSIARELNIDFFGAKSQFFETVVIDNCIKLSARDPLSVGHLDYDAETLQPRRFSMSPQGNLHLWINPTFDGRIGVDRVFACGCDIAAGTASPFEKKSSSNSVACFGDKLTGEKVAELAVAGMLPEDFARLVIALCRWFRGASEEGCFLAWEANGPGLTFTRTVIQAGYRNIYYRRKEDKVTKEITEKPGWWSDTKNKRNLLSAYFSALRSGEFVNHSKVALEEMRHYTYLSADDIGHERSRIKDDPTGAGANHADRVIADAVLWEAMKSVQREERDEKVEESNTFFARQQARRKREKEASNLGW